MARRRRPKHRAGCRHCYRVGLLGRDFHGWRASWEAAREAVAIGYETEGVEFAQRHQPPTFKHYLIQMAGTGWPMSGQEPPRRQLRTTQPPRSDGW